MFRDIVLSGAAACGVALTDDAAERLEKYWALVAEKNKVMNLTAIEDADEAARLHFLDCIALLSVCPLRGMGIDVGTGGGFPGVPLAVAAPGTQFTLLDATEKKIAFVESACRALSIEAECVAGRAEELARDGMLRGQFDFAVSRAVARLAMLAELAMPFVKVGGTFVAMKSSDSDDEIAEAKCAIRLLGGDAPDVREYAVPGTEIVRRAVVIKKIAPTPDKYPRSWGKIKKAPLA